MKLQIIRTAFYLVHWPHTNWHKTKLSKKSLKILKSMQKP